MVLALVAALGLLAAPFLAVAPNRLLPGEPVAAWVSLGWLLLPTAASLAGAAWLGAARPLLGAGLAAVALLLLLLGAGAGAARALVGAAPTARAALGGGAWLSLMAAGLLLIERLRLVPPRGRILAALGLCGLLGELAALGRLDALSIAVEYAARADRVHEAMLEHLALACAALLLAFCIAVPLALWALAAPAVEAAAGAVLDAVQVVPAIALFGVLLPLLAAVLAAVPSLRALGLAAIGSTPAVLATGAYVALPLFRAIRAGLDAAPPEALEAGRAMGFAARDMLLRLRLPLGVRTFRAGLRVAAVQAIGLATLGGLIGAGGLGALVFEGMAQFSADLILLGALPVIALAWAADAALA